MLSCAVGGMLIASCQKQDAAFFDPSAAEPTIGEITLDQPRLRYGESVTIRVEATDAEALSHLEIRLMADQEVLYTGVVPANDRKSLTVEQEIQVAFGPLRATRSASLEVVAVNKSMKTAGRTRDIVLERPVFEQLYLVVDGTGQEIALTKDESSPSTSYLYSAEVDLPNNTNVFVYSQPGKQGLAWGFDPSANICALASSTPTSLCDSYDMEEKVRKVTFDAFSFDITPLKKNLAANGVLFMLYKKEASNEDFVSNVLRAQDVPLTNGEEVSTELIDLDAVTFDPDFFAYEGGKLTYIGRTGTATLYLNTLYDFVFVESGENPISTNASYPDVLFVNGWGMARPELWNYHPDWDFNKAVIFRKVSEDDSQTVYAQTVVTSKWVQFKFYDEKDWGGEFPCPDITFEDDTFKALEENGKPDNYNIVPSLGDATSWKSAVVKITFMVPKSGVATRLRSVVLAESDQD
jgi:hypothetical protein